MFSEGEKSTIKQKRSLYNIFLLMVGMLISKIFGCFREIIIAHRFGAGSISDAFLLTNNIPNILFLSIGVAINMNFIPMYLNFKDSSERNYFASNLLNVCIVFAVFGCITINLFSHSILWAFAPNLPEETLYYAVVMLRIVSVSIIPILIRQLFQAYSQAHGTFLSTAFVGNVVNVVLIMSYYIAEERTYYILSIGMVVAQLSAMCLMVLNANKVGFSWKPICDFFDGNVISMFLLTLPLMLGKFMEDASLLVDRNLAAGLGTGVISAMAYASLLTKSASSVVIEAIATASFPAFSKLAGEGRMDEFLVEFHKYCKVLCVSLCPIFVFTIIFADDIVSFVLKHGALQSSAIDMIYFCTICYAAGIVPFGMQTFLVRGFYAFRDMKLPTCIVVFSLFCNICLSVWGAHVFGYIGITISTSISYFFASVLLVYCFARKYCLPIIMPILKELTFCLLLTVLPAVFCYWLFRIECITNSLVLRMFLESGFFFGIYLVLFFLMHKDLFQQFMGIVRKYV